MAQVEISVDSERRIIQAELRFFDRQSDISTSPQGILTETDPLILTRLYPPILRGMSVVYGQLNRRIALVDGSADRLYIEVLAAKAKQGEMVSDREANKIRESIERDGGEQAKALQAQSVLQKEEEELGFTISFFGERQARRDFHTAISEEDIVRNKHVVLETFEAISRYVNQIYGEGADARDVLLTELLLEAPFTETVIASQGDGLEIDAETRNRHESYVTSSARFAESVDMDSRLRSFELLTGKFPTDVVERSAPVTISENDRTYVARLHQLAKAIRSGEWSLDDLYALLGETLFKKSGVFEYSPTDDDQGEFTPFNMHSVSFDDIVGYQENTNYYRKLLDRLKENSPALADVNIILVVGKAGIGKSLGIKAFLANLPENARGIVFDYRKTRKMPGFEEFVRMANLHPGQHFFIVLEDIEKSYASEDLLEIDAVSPNEMPGNLHFIATTTNADKLDDGLLRPGRSKILLYGLPDENERRKIAELHAAKREIHLSPQVISAIVANSKGFTPDEIVGIFRELRMEGVASPSEQDVKKWIEDIKNRKNIKGLLKRLTKALRI